MVCSCKLTQAYEYNNNSNRSRGTPFGHWDRVLPAPFGGVRQEKVNRDRYQADAYRRERRSAENHRRSQEEVRGTAHKFKGGREEERTRIQGDREKTH